jgi:hypothetical protein
VVWISPFTARIDSAISLVFIRIQRGSWCGLHCAHRATTIDLINPSKLACFSSLGRAFMLVYVRPSNEVADDPSKLARSFFLQGWGLIDLPLRAAFSPAHPLADTFHPPYPPIASQSIPRDVPLARRGPSNPLYLSLREWPRLPFTARIGRAQFHRARSASKKDTWPLPPHPSEAARCASPEDHQAPSPPLFREHRTNVGVLPILFIVRVL